jgi:hypothetical protein
MSPWLVVFKSDTRAELGVMVDASDALGAVSAALREWPLGDVRDVIRIERDPWGWS